MQYAPPAGLHVQVALVINSLVHKPFNHEQKSRILFDLLPARSLYYRCLYPRFLSCLNWP
jgi:hypothetical protein